MAVNYPASLDIFINPSSNSSVANPSHSQQHSDANDAIEALEAKVGITGSAVTTSHDYKIAQLESLVTSSVAGAKSIYQDVRNQSGSSLSKATPVYVSGSEGASGKMLISAASNAAESTSSKTMGITTSAIADNSNGQVISEGILEGIDTTGAADGDPVWLGTNGAKIYGLANKPSAPSHLVFLGIVIRGGQANTGSMYVKIQNGFELEELHNVQISSLINGNIIAYDSTAGTWKNTNTLQSTASTIPLIIKAVSSQTTNLFEVQSSTGTSTFIINGGSFSGSGTVSVGNTALAGTSFNSQLYVQNNNAARIGVIVKGTASQTANLQEWQDSSGTNLLKLSPAGKLIFGSGNSAGSITSIYFDQVTTSTNTPDGITWNFVTTNTSSAQVMAVRTAASYATDLYFTTANAGDQIATERMRISSTGNVAINGFLSSAIGLVIKGATSQTASLQEWQNSSGTVLANITSGGTFFAQSLSSSSTGYQGNIASTDGTKGNLNFNTSGYGLLVTSAQTSAVVLAARGAASQTGDLQQWQDSSGAVQAKIDSTGYGLAVKRFGVSSLLTVPATAMSYFETAAVGNQGIVVRGAASQTANLQEWQNSSGTVIANITPSGGLYVNSNLTQNASGRTFIGGANDYSAFLNVSIPTASRQGIVIRANASQTANLQEWQDSSGTALTYVAANGTITTPGIISGANGLRSNAAMSVQLPVFTDSAQLAVSTSGAGYKGILVRGVASQTANLQEWQDSSGTALTAIDSTGRITSTVGLYTNTKISIGGASWSGGNANLNVFSTSTSNPTIVTRASSSQTSNLTEWQDSSGTALTKITSDGRLIVSNNTSSEYLLNLVQGSSSSAAHLVSQGSGYLGWVGLRPNDTRRFAFESDPTNNGATFGLWQYDSSGLNSIQVFGSSYGNGMTIPKILAQPLSYSITPLIVKGIASQTADLTQWQDSFGTVLSKVDSSGNITAPSITASSITASSYNLSNSLYSLRKTIKKTVGNGTAVPINTTYDLFQFNFSASLQGTFYFQVSMRGGGYGQNLTYSLPVTYAMDWLSQGYSGNPFTNNTTWVSLTPQTFSGRHLMVGDNLKLQARVDANIIYFRLKSNAALSSGGNSPYFDVYIQHSEEFAGCSITEYSTTGTDTDSQTTLANFLSSKGGTTELFNPVTIISNSTGNIPLIVKGFSSQTANLQQWQNNSGGILSFIRQDGVFGSSGLRNTSENGPYIDLGTSSILLNTRTASNTGLIVKGVASQTANLQEWQDNSGTALTRITSNGVLQYNPSLGDKIHLYNSEYGIGIQSYATVLFASSNTLGRVSIRPGFGSGNADAVELFTSGRIKQTLTEPGSVGNIIKAASSQTADLQQWQNNAGTVLAKVDKDGNITAQNLTLNGDLSVAGTTTTVNASDLVVTDPMIYMGDGNQSSILDLGIVAAFNNGTYQHSGLVRDASDNKWKLFSGVIPEPTTTIDFTSAIYDTLKLGVLETTGALNINTSGTGTINLGDGTIVKGPGNGFTINSDLNILDGKGLYASIGNFTNTTGTSTVPLTVKGIASQAANLQEWQNSSGTVVANIGISSASFMGTTASSLYTVGINAPANTNTILTVGATGWINFNQSTAVHGIYTRPVNAGTGDVIGIYSQPVTGNATGHTNITSFSAGIRSAGGAGSVITNAYNFYANSPTMSSGTVTNLYGLYLNTQKDTNVTNAYGLYQVGVNDLNYLAGRTTIQSGSSSYVPFTIKAASSQTANLTEWQDNAGTVVSRATVGGSWLGVGVLMAGTVSPTASQFGVIPSTSTTVAAIIKGASSQTADLQQWQNSAGTTYLNITNAGTMISSGGVTIASNPTINAYGAAMKIASGVNTYPMLILQAASSQTADIQQWQNSGSTVIASIDAYGNAGFGGGAASSNQGLYVKTNSNPAVVGIIVQGATSQTADLQQWKNVGGTAIAKVDASGNFSAVSKSFDIPHPTKENMRLRYASLEGNEHGVYVRGTTKEKIIELPDYWLNLVDENSITVHLTCIGKPRKVYVKKIEGNKVYLGGRLKEAAYIIHAERKDIAKLTVEY